MWERNIFISSVSSSHDGEEDCLIKIKCFKLSAEPRTSKSGVKILERKTLAESGSNTPVSGLDFLWFSGLDFYLL